MNPLPTLLIKSNIAAASRLDKLAKDMEKAVALDRLFDLAWKEKRNLYAIMNRTKTPGKGTVEKKLIDLGIEVVAGARQELTFGPNWGGNLDRQFFVAGDDEIALIRALLTNDILEYTNEEAKFFARGLEFKELAIKRILDGNLIPFLSMKHAKLAKREFTQRGLESRISSIYFGGDSPLCFLLVDQQTVEKARKGLSLSASSKEANADPRRAVSHTAIYIDGKLTVRQLNQCQGAAKLLTEALHSGKKIELWAIDHKGRKIKPYGENKIKELRKLASLFEKQNDMLLNKLIHETLDAQYSWPGSGTTFNSIKKVRLSVVRSADKRVTIKATNQAYQIGKLLGISDFWIYTSDKSGESRFSPETRLLRHMKYGNTMTVLKCKCQLADLKKADALLEVVDFTVGELLKSGKTFKQLTNGGAASYKVNYADLHKQVRGLKESLRFVA